MERKTKSRFLIGGLFIATFAIGIYTYWVFLRADGNEGDWQSFFLNLSTELIGALVVFIFVNFFFFVDDWDLSERVQHLLNRLERERPKTEKFFQKMPEISPQIHEADGIDLCGVSLTSTISKQFTQLYDGLAQGKPVRILIVDPRTTAVEMANARSESQDMAYYKKRLDASFGDIAYLWQKREALVEEGRAGELQVRLMPYAPSFGLFVFHTAHSKGKMHVEVYPHHRGYGAPPVFYLDESDDQHWYKYFLNQFEDMWSYAVEWTPDLFQVGHTDGRTVYSEARAQDFFFENNPDQSVYFRAASEICLLGIDLAKTLAFNMHSLQKSFEKSNTKIRLIISSKDVYDSNQERSMELLQTLISNPNSNGIIEVREFLGKIPFSIIATDPKLMNGHIQVMLYLPIWRNKSNAKFELFHDRDSYWMNFFLDQFEEMWQASALILSNAKQEQNTKEKNQIR